VSRLVDHGLVYRTVSAADARRTELGLTPAGRALLKTVPATPQARALVALEGLSSSARKGLLEGLLVMVDAMGASDEPATMFFEEHAHERPRKAKPRPAADKRGAP